MSKKHLDKAIKELNKVSPPFGVKRILDADIVIGSDSHLNIHFGGDRDYASKDEAIDALQWWIDLLGEE